MGEEEAEVNQRLKITDGMNPHIIKSIQRILHENNNLLALFKHALDRMPNDEYKIVIKADQIPTGLHKKQLNAPSVNEIAILMVNTENTSRDIIIQKRDNTLQKIRETHRSYDALQYPLIFWQGEDGYHFNIKQFDRKKNRENTKKVKKKIKIHKNTHNSYLCIFF